MFPGCGTSIGNGVVHAGHSPVAAPGGFGAVVLLGKGLGSLKLYLLSNILVSYWFYSPGKVSWMT